MLVWLQQWKWWLCCVTRGAAARPCPERRLFVQILWQTEVGVCGQTGSIQQQHFPMWHRNTQACRTKESLKIPLFTYAIFSLPVIAFTVRISCTALTPKTLRLHVYFQTDLPLNNQTQFSPTRRNWWLPSFTVREVDEDNLENSSRNRKRDEKREENANEPLIM